MGDNITIIDQSRDSVDLIEQTDETVFVIQQVGAQGPPGPAGTGGGGALSISAGASSASLASVVFSNSNGVSFGLSNSTLTASHNGLTDAAVFLGSAATQSFRHTSADSQLQFTSANSNFLGTGATQSFRHTSADSQLQFTSANSNFLSTGATQSFRHTSADSQLQFTSANSNFLGTGATQSFRHTSADSQLRFTSADSQLQFTSANSNFLGTAATQSFRHTSADSQLRFTSADSQLQFTSANSNFLGTGATASFRFTSQNSQLRFTSNAIGAVGISTAGNSAGTTGSEIGTYWFQGGNNITLSQITSNNGSHTLIVSGANAVAQTNQTLGIAATGNTTQSSTGTQDARSLTFNGAGIVSVGFSNGSVVISATGGGAADGGVGISAAGQSASAGTITLSNSNGLAFGMAGSVITGSYTVPTQTNQTLSLVATGNTTQNTTAIIDARSLTLRGDAGISVGLSNGSIVFSAKTDYQSSNAGYLTSQSNQAVSGSNGSFTFQTANFSNANGMSFGTSAGPAITASYTVPTVTNSSWTVSDNATSATVGRLAFTQANGITMSLSTSNNGQHTVFASHNGLTSQSNQAFSASGGSSAFQTLGFSNANGFTFSNSNGSVVGSYTVPTQSNQTIGIAATGNTTQSSTGTQDARSLTFQGAGAVSIGVSNGSVVISGGSAAPSPIIVSAGANSGSISSLVFSNSNLVSFGLNGSTITGSVPGTSSLSATGAVSISVNASTISIGAPNQTNQDISFFAQGNTTQNSSSVINASSLQFAGRGPVSIGYSNGTVQISGGPNLQYFELDDVQGMGLMTNLKDINSTPIFVPFILKGNLTNSSMFLQVSRSTSGSNAFTVQAAIYTYVNATSISRLGSLQNVFSNANTASVSGVRYIALSGWENAVTALTPGAYVMGFNFSAGATASMNYSLFGGQTQSAPVGFISGGTDQNNTNNTTLGIVNLWGRYTANSGTLPAAVAQSHVLANFSGASQPIAPWFLLR